MNLRRGVCALSLLGLATAGVSACASNTTNGNPQAADPSGGATSPGAGSSAPSGATTSGTAGTSSTPAPASSAAGGDARQQFADALAHGYRATRTARLRIQGGVAGQSANATGAEHFANGKVDAFRIAESFGPLQLQFVMTGGKTYVELPKAQRMGASKPWFAVSSRSKNAVVRSLASSVSSSLTSTPLDYLSKLKTAATSVQNAGTSDGLTHYHVVLDPTKLGTGSSTQALQRLGIHSLPLDVYLDSAGRPRKVTESFSVAGQRVNLQVLATAYNQPVTIKAPPSNQINPD